MSESLSQALAGLSQALQDTSSLAVDDALQLAALIPLLQQRVVADADADCQHDPRFALTLATAAESAAHHALRTQIHAAHLLEDTAAHTLTGDELSALRHGTADYARGPERTGKRPSFTSPTALLAAWIHVEHFEAARRIDSAHHVIAQYDYQHQPYPAKFPLMARRFADPALPPAEALSAARRLNALEPPREEFAAPATSTALTEDGDLVESEIDQELAEPDPAIRHKAVSSCFKQARKRHSKQQPEAQEGVFRKGERNGLMHYDVALRPVRAELFESSIAQSDNPRSEAGRAARETPEAQGSGQAATGSTSDTGHGFAGACGDHPDFVTDAEAASAEPDAAPIPPAARRLNGLMNLLEINAKRLRALIAATLNQPRPAGAQPQAEPELDIPTIAPQVVVMLTLDELEGRARTHGITAHGFDLNASDLRQTLAKARIIPVVLGGRGEILDIGRSQRKHPKYMRLGITVRDRGCIVPGCTMDPERCNIHHIRFWAEGGVTAVYWSAMLCDTHHHDVHAGLLKVIPDAGVPKVILPEYLDPSQRPVRNSFYNAKAA